VRVHQGIEKVLTGISVHFVPEKVVAENHMPVCEILEITPQSMSYSLKMVSCGGSTGIVPKRIVDYRSTRRMID
jgi:hypothetical protein